MTTQEFVDHAERVLETAPPSEYATVRAGLIARARSEFGAGIAREVNDALPDTPLTGAAIH